MIVKDRMEMDSAGADLVVRVVPIAPAAKVPAVLNRVVAVRAADLVDRVAQALTAGRG